MEIVQEKVDYLILENLNKKELTEKYKACDFFSISNGEGICIKLINAKTNTCLIKKMDNSFRIFFCYSSIIEEDKLNVKKVVDVDHVTDINQEIVNYLNLI